MGQTTSGPSNPRPAGAVMCPECGCEITEETGTDADDRMRQLNPAA